MARPKNQTARRAQLVAAATRAVSAHGPARVRVADIADAAGVARGSVHYYFQDLSELLRQVYKEAVDRFFTRRMARVSVLSDARDKLVASARCGLPSGPDDELVRALYRFGSDLPDDPVYQALIQGLTDRQVAVYAGILEVGVAQGHFHPAEPVLDIATNLVGLEDAFGMYIIASSPSVTTERALELILGYARTATGCAELVPDRPTAQTPDGTTRSQPAAPPEDPAP
ncbi:TetR/AcrR family transcriptional regulator [Streptomyces sp. NPDC058067]|uniref:TetR/AcrR family transcriptional regulator n=1 Tax=Streptomyces sp. NPDC058067 TaxID=3346324 RepID=UPI0036E83943